MHLQGDTTMLIVSRPRHATNVDRAFQQLASSFFTPTPSRVGAPTVDASWKDGTLMLTVDLPGVPGEALSVDVADRTLTIAAHHDGDGRSLRWSQAVRLPSTLDVDQVAARYADGRLTVTVGAAPQPEARRIQIEGVAAAEQTAIEASGD
jgi:HSP20 family molecular chaperone IbpA